MNHQTSIYIGCAGWSLRKEHLPLFSIDGTHLHRYSRVFSTVEINTSFYRHHMPKTYLKWATSVPDHFKFAVKVPKEITHTRKLIDVKVVLTRFLSEVQSLGSKLGPLLIQLPPSLTFEPSNARKFFSFLRVSYHGIVVIEPRHSSWFQSDATLLMTQYRVSFVIADPVIASTPSDPSQYTVLYYRLHGSPKMYYSSYSETFIRAFSRKLIEVSKTSNVYCLFDNTAQGAATINALSLLKYIRMHET